MPTKDLIEAAGMLLEIALSAAGVSPWWLIAVKVITAAAKLLAP